MNSKKQRKSQRGFTLIETIAVLVLVGIMAALAGLGLSTAVRGYLIASENAAITQKAQLAMTRISREIIECFDCNVSIPLGGGGTSFTFKNTLGDRELSIASGTLKLGEPGDTNDLLDGVNGFNLSRQTDGRITITLGIRHQPGGSPQVFETSILPRNI